LLSYCLSSPVQRLQAFVRRPHGPSAPPPPSSAPSSRSLSAPGSLRLPFTSRFLSVFPHYYPRQIRVSTSRRSSAFRRRSSPTHAFGTPLALVSLLISICAHAVRARPPSSRCRHHRHPRCHQHSTDHPQLPHAQHTRTPLHPAAQAFVPYAIWDCTSSSSSSATPAPLLWRVPPTPVHCTFLPLQN